MGMGFCFNSHEFHEPRVTIHGYRRTSEPLKGEGDENTNLHLKAFGVGIRLFSEEIGP
jgi:hypothetical protein